MLFPAEMVPVTTPAMSSLAMELFSSVYFPPVNTTSSFEFSTVEMLPATSVLMLALNPSPTARPVSSSGENTPSPSRSVKKTIAFPASICTSRRSLTSKVPLRFASKKILSVAPARKPILAPTVVVELISLARFIALTVGVAMSTTFKSTALTRKVAGAIRASRISGCV